MADDVLEGTEDVVWALGERVKELKALHAVARLLHQEHISVSDLLKAIADLLPPAFRYPESTSVRVMHGTFLYETRGFSEEHSRISASTTTSEGSPLSIEVSCPDQPGSVQEQIFLAEERVLIDSVVELLRGALARRRVQERLELAVTGTGAGVWEWDMETGRVIWSEEMERMAWLRPGEFEGTLEAFRALIHPDDKPILLADMRRCAEDPTVNVFSSDLRLVNEHGESRWISSTGQIFRHPDGRAYRMLGLATDSSAKRSLEEQLQQAQKLEAIGGLAAGIAHDFNNVLTVVLSYAELALLDLPPTAAGRAEMEEIREAGMRARDLTRHLLAFSRQQVLQPRVLNLNDTLLGLEKLLRRLLPEEVHLTLITAPDLGRVNADPTQIEQVIVNLVVNARDAMPTGGHLSLQTENVEFDATRAAEQVGLTPGRYVRLSVSDTGAGIPAAARARIFEPFFTTKGPGRGTGLGLATVLGIVKQSGGYISVESEIGLGTRFDVYFPLSEQPADPIIIPSLEPKLVNGTETILLVEDEDQVRNLVRTILRRGGYEVLEACNAGEALLLCERHANRIDVVLTDVVMPLMSGRELAERLRGIVPNLKVLFMSGYTDDAILRQGIAQVPATSLVPKPLTPNELLQKVRDLLDAS